MAEDKKNNSFSFDNDPGKLSDKDDVDFTFSDIPVLGTSKEKKDAFSFDQVPEGDDPSIASFEAMLRDTADGNDESSEYDDATRTSMDIERVKLDRQAKKKKRLIIQSSIAVAALLFVGAVITVVVYVNKKAAEKAKTEAKKLTPAQKAALKAERQREKLRKMVEAADAVYDSEDFTAAASKYSEILEIDPNNAFALTGAGNCCEANKKYDEAEKFFRQALEQKKTTPGAFAGVGKILIKAKKYKDAVELLEKAVEKFPEEKIVLIPLADSYYVLDRNGEALDTYKKIPKSSLKKKSLRAFAKLLGLESKCKAKKLYVYTANKFKDFSSFINAAEMADDVDDKVQILTDCVAALKDEKDSENAKFILAKAKIEAGNKKDAADTINSLLFEKINPEYSRNMLHTATDAGIIDLKKITTNLLNANSDDLKLQKAIQKQLKKISGSEAVLEVYSAWWTVNSEKPIANFLYAKALGNSSSAKDYYRKTLSIDPKFFQASMELGKIAMNEKKWSDAEKAFAYCAKTIKNNKNARFLFALTKVKNGKKKASIDEYGKFLDTLGLTPFQKAAELVPLALLLPNPKLADHYLNVMKEDSKLLKKYKLYKAKRFLLFPGKQGNAFSGRKKGEFREYCILNMLAHGKERDVLLMSTPKAEFPDFWKVFIARRKGFKNWEKNAELLFEKNKNNTDPTTKIIAALWLGKITVEEASKMLNRISFDKEALFYMMLAEEYKRKGKKTKAEIRYRKAMNCGRNVYSGVIKYYRNQL